MRHRPHPTPPQRRREDPPDECEWRGCERPPQWEAMWRDRDHDERDYGYFCGSHRPDVNAVDHPSQWRGI